MVLLENAYWKRQFAGDPAIVGKEIDLNGSPATVVGVLPASFLAGLAISGLDDLHDAYTQLIRAWSARDTATSPQIGQNQNRSAAEPQCGLTERARCKGDFAIDVVLVRVEKAERPASRPIRDALF